MIFSYKKWDSFCKKLADRGIKSIPAMQVQGNKEKYLVLKHDVETDVAKAYTLAKIEQRYGHKGTYYVQSYLLDSENNVKLLSEMQSPLQSLLFAILVTLYRVLTSYILFEQKKKYSYFNNCTYFRSTP